MLTTTEKKITDTLLENLNVANHHSNFQVQKKKAIDYLSINGLPAVKDEEYKFTAITKKLDSHLTHPFAAKSIKLSKEDIGSELLADLNGDVIVMNNGKFEQDLSVFKQKGYTVRCFSDMGESFMEMGAGKESPSDKDPFAHLNTAMFEDGVYLQIADNTKLEQPITILYINQAVQGQVVSPRLRIDLGTNSEAAVFEQNVNKGGGFYFFNSFVETSVGANSHFYLYKIQKDNQDIVEVNNLESNVQKDATFTSYILSLGGAMTRNNVKLNLLDSGCEGNMYGLYLLMGDSHVDNHTSVDHIKPHSQSNELYKGILTDQSRGVFNGKIFVRPDAQKTNAFQQNNNILLSEDAVIHTKPQLEIWADDVKCSHGCTTGQLDAEALFYLRSRGLEKEMANGMLLFAFAAEVVDKIKDPIIKSYFNTLVSKRLGS